MKIFSVDGRLPIIEANRIQRYGRKENVRTFGVEEEPDDDVIAKVVNVAKNAGITITTNDFSTCHRLLSKGKGPKPLTAKFVWRDSKHHLMKHKRNLKETTIDLYDGLNHLIAKITSVGR